MKDFEDNGSFQTKMKTAIVYKSRHGTTEKIAQLIAAKLSDHHITIIDLRISPWESIVEFDRIIIGGSIHMGKIQEAVRIFCDDNMDVLLKRELGLFMCGLNEEKLKEEFDLSFPRALRKHSKANGIFGGEFLFERMNILEKLIVKKLAHVHESISKIDYPAIDKFILEIEGDTLPETKGKVSAEGEKV